MSRKTIAVCLCFFALLPVQVRGSQGEVIIPAAIIRMTKKYAETTVLIDYYKEICNDPDYLTREVDISDDLATDEAPLFLQWDKRWAFYPYGQKSMIAMSGCAPVCLSMALCHFTKDASMHPRKIADFSSWHGYYMEFCGTKNTLFTEGAQTLGLRCQPEEKNAAQLFQRLDDGHLLVALMRSGHFVKAGGHFILIRGHNDAGGFFVNDPNSLINSRRVWPKDIVLGEAKLMWSLSLPE